MKVAVVPSNQHLNTYVGIPGLTEESVMVRAARACRYELERQGQEAQVFWVAGSGSKSTDELAQMMREAVAWKPDILLSLHSDAGSGAPRDIYPLIGGESDRAWAVKVGQNLARRVGFAFQAPTVRKGLLFFSMSEGHRRLLLEIGQHDRAADAGFNDRYAEFLGTMAARALLEVEGVLEGDGPVAGEVPPGLERWKLAESPSLSGYFEGFADGSYRWEQPLTRGQADRVLLRVKDEVTELRRGLAAVVERLENVEAVTVYPPGVVNGYVALDTPVSGEWGGMAETLSKSLGNTVLAKVLAPLYVEYGAVFHLRADVLWAQMALETGNLKFGGVVKQEQNNYCGLKTRDSKGFASFADPEIGVLAHCEHMSWYVNRVCVPPCGHYDPRHLGAHGSNGWVETVSDLAGKWAPSADYADKVVARAKQLFGG